MNIKSGCMSVLIFILLLYSVSTSSFLYAQRLTGKIVGTVTDEEGVPLPGVTVDISSPAMMGTRSEVTSDMGTFRFINLAPGIYKIVFTLQSFQTVERQNIRVAIDSTITLDITMKQATLEEAVEVIAEAPVIDVTKSGMSTNFAKEELENIPSGRGSFGDIIKQAPGIVSLSEGSNSRFTFGGSGMEANAFYFDGVDESSPELGVPWVSPSQDIYEEVEVSGFGASAEYGQFTGAVVNIVTKSGGNKFSGALSHYGQYDFLTGDNNPDPASYESFKRFYFHDLSLSLGGPVKKDKLWFFVNGNILRSKAAEWQSNPDFAGKSVANQAFIKISGQINPSHRLVGNFHYAYDTYYPAATPWVTPEAIKREAYWNYTWNGQYTWLISSNSFFDLKYAGYWSHNPTGLNDYGGDDDGNYTIKAHEDLLTGIRSEAVWRHVDFIISRHQANASYSHFAENFLGGDHDFKIGIQYLHGFNSGVGRTPGEGIYYDWGGEPYIKWEQQNWKFGGVLNSIAGFIDDAWKIGKRLVINFGLRYDYNSADYPEFPKIKYYEELPETVPGINDLISWNVFSPRLGFVYQLTSDGKTVLKASYGRYYEAIHVANFNFPGPGATDKFWSEWDGTDWVVYDIELAGQQYTMDPDLKNPYADQLAIGLERELFLDFSLSATYLYKHEGNLLGWEDRAATYVEVSRISPDNGETYTVFNRTSAPDVHDYWQTNPDSYEQEYRGFIVSLTKKYSNNWQMNASVTWSHSYGLTMNAHSLGQMGMTWYAYDFGKDPNTLINAYGDLQTDRRWVIKVSGSYRFPLDILFGVNYLYWTGVPRPIFVRIPDLAQGFTRILAEERGKTRHPDLQSLSLRLQKTFAIQNTFRLNIMLDAFNVLNDDTLREYVSYNLWSPAFTEGTWLVYPRRIQLGIKIEF